RRDGTGRRCTRPFAAPLARACPEGAGSLPVRHSERVGERREHAERTHDRLELRAAERHRHTTTSRPCAARAAFRSAGVRACATGSARTARSVVQDGLRRRYDADHGGPAMVTKAARGAWESALAIAPGRALYVGPAGDTSAHAHWAIQIAIGLDGPVVLDAGG